MMITHHASRNDLFTLLNGKQNGLVLRYAYTTNAPAGARPADGGRPGIRQPDLVSQGPAGKAEDEGEYWLSLHLPLTTRLYSL